MTMRDLPEVPALPEFRAARAPSDPAIADDRLDLSNAEFAAAVRTAATRLAEYGVERGDVVGLLLPNRVELVVAVFAAWRLGAAVTPINPALAPPEITYQAADAGARVLVTEDGTETPDGVAAVACHELLAVADDVPVEPVPVRPSDLALLIYTAGTTGKPKGVMITHGNIAAMTASFIEHFAFTERDHSLLVLPLFHANGVVLGTLTPLRAGGRTTIVGRFRPEEFFPAVERHRPTYFSAVPAIYAMLTALPGDVLPDASSLRFGICGAAPMPVDLIERFESRFGVPIVEGYGLSETTTASAINPLDGPRKPGTVGPALPGQRIRIVDGALRDVAAGETGEVLIAGKVVMAGYLNRPEATAETIVDGWLRTGDVGLLDEDGYLRLVDRVKDMVIRGGENIYPKEIEAQLYRNPQVFEAAVIGRHHEVLGEVPVAYVSLREGATVTAAELLDGLRGELAKVKVPVDLMLLDDVPKNPVGKIDKPTLRQRDRAQP
ncbi:class I adenylate-forming enzyme family protein [Tsukamurella ocularis]|uniref:class I adenylate-forming enzyme family protein n=1 Tax=Tsukamurella ocularis TaxID=1970234 RepID=UPI002166F26F|nr:AMP-binding protein [Tsukamurella ocularis]MCS3779209.1 acyl-CoA synthetase (AMP-forming)/AMP-acid ligase II [Tsukamurella ocularis]MCS3787171.1 acyl-CoA synthetase (AMP-forming)/AMP-acid ligase II [Tsukamurella ocularis]MCS3852562.1 acyl-CoA synthetase (AMP-forming)/AMP-acid ligase II [Tsukamurella ocularis]